MSRLRVVYVTKNDGEALTKISTILCEFYLFLTGCIHASYPRKKPKE